MPSAGLEPAIKAREGPQIHASDRASTATGAYVYIHPIEAHTEYRSLN